MKKKITTFLALLLTVSLTACTTSEGTKKKNKKKDKKKDDEISDIEEEDAGKTTNENFSPDITFTIEDLNGNTIDESVFAEHKVTMINFWEPWCGPCVNEMPELQRLYMDYRDQGLYIIGVFSSTDDMDEVEQIVYDCHVTYPVAIYDSAFDVFQSGYVPTTIFVDQDGHVIPVSNGYGSNVIVGSNSYDDWAAIIKDFL